ncbi:MAG TPA: DNA-processing protein DprA [Polyangiales bacterium]
MSSPEISLPRAAFTLRPSDAAWPKGLSELPKPPAAVQIAGELPRGHCVAIVGTRFADPEALAFAQQLAAALTLAGVTVVSGGAAGVDAAAHQGALDAGGSTLAVLATGLSRAYPPAHGPLFSLIARQGALLCEAIAAPHRPERWTFLRRNQLIAALCGCVVVVQAPLRSGALSTAAWANRLKRPVFAVPAAPWDVRGLGCLQLLRQGARICTSAADVLSLRPSAAGQVPLPGLLLDPASVEKAKDDERLCQSPKPRVAAPSARVLEVLEQGPAHPDELACRLDMQAARVQEALLTLVLAGLVRQGVDGTYSRTPD